MFTGIERVLSEHGYTVGLYSTSEIPAKENLIIERICQQRMDGVILVTCQPQKLSAFKKFENANIKTVFLEREVEHAGYNYLGYNSHDSFYAIDVHINNYTALSVELLDNVRKKYALLEVLPLALCN